MKNPVTIAITGLLMAEKEGFEPSRPFRGLHDFQSCALDQLGDFSIAVDCFCRYSYRVPQRRTVVIIPELFPKSSLFSNFLRRAFDGSPARRRRQTDPAAGIKDFLQFPSRSSGAFLWRRRKCDLCHKTSLIKIGKRREAWYTTFQSIHGNGVDA